ncbi:hypothetical protein [Comamonas sp. JC664]|uniref:hypothetical protein n=1 Tax=Comamonas sp. JC664 TaxID=2801917 RepID=UPI00174C696F|nr:hypothetical protein [Comamonas sp. JC664]MBL0698843.1 hypothetical protein [Comamonas sp. JC664]GHG79188.1 hypothetical protein GCM10012319_30720 [Comamonas sp. KCTC 72670]
MTALPHALRPWAATLSRLPLELALHLGPLVARLSVALGALRSPAELAGGELQGYDGISRRGLFDRLLVSEWLWALEAPEELVRRAAFSELSYLQPAFRQPRSEKRIVALLDAGPDQLGAPRIAQLALLIVLARRAEAEGATFSWGILQEDPGKGPFPEVTPSTLREWLAARSLAPPTAERLAAWRQSLAPDLDGAEAWLVGAQRLSQLPGAETLSRVEVSEVMAPDVRQLAVEVHPIARGSRSVLLDLPPPAACVQLLKDPFGQEPRSPIASSVKKLRAPRVRAFTFSSDGQRLMLFHADGGVSAMALPQSSSATVPIPNRMKPVDHEVFVGAGWRAGMGMFVLCQRPQGYGIRGPMRHLGVPRQEAHFPWSMRDMDVRPPLRTREQLPGRLTSYYDSQGQLCLLLSGLDANLYLLHQLRTESAPRVMAQRVAKDVITVATVKDQCVPVMRTGAGGGVALGTVGMKEVRLAPLPDSEGGAVFFGASEGGVGHPDPGLLAVNQRPGLWHLHSQGAARPVQLAAGLRAVGVGVCHPTRAQAGLVALDSDQRGFWCVGPQHQFKLTVADARVVHAEVSHAVPVLAWLTAEGELVLFHLREESVLYRLQVGGGA